MGSKKIIVPQGLINPNETTIIEIPAGVGSDATLIARSSSPCEAQPMFEAYQNKSGADKNEEVYTSSMIFQDQKETAKTANTYKNHYGGNSKYTENRTQLSNTKNVLQFANTCPELQETDATSCESTREYSYFEPSQGIHRQSPNLPYVLQNRMKTSPFRTSKGQSVSSEVPKSCPGNGYCFQPSSHKNVARKMIKPRYFSNGEYTETKSAHYGPSRNQPQYQVQKSVNMDDTTNPSSSGYTTSTKASSKCYRNNERQKSSLMNQVNQFSLFKEIKRHLSEIEEDERVRINRDLKIFQEARRKLVEDTANISASGESLPRANRNI